MPLHRVSPDRERTLTVFLLWLILLAPAASLLLGGCGKKQDVKNAVAGLEHQSLYSLELTKDRKQKDLYLLTNERSPLKEEDKDRFEGLDYFAPDTAFAFPVTLRRYPAPKEIVMATSKDKPREMWCIGYFPFQYEGAEHRLQVYMPKDTSDGAYWFIPFADASTGKETYEGGRFIDIEDISSDSTFLDFNYAYNPYCAYNPRYDCPIPPAENRLSVAIRAGEKKYPLH